MKLLKYYCSNCNKRHSKFSGYCYSCNLSGSIIEDEIIEKEIKKNYKIIEPLSLSSIKNIEEEIRIKSKIEEFDRVLGDGLVRNSAILLSGVPGIGKSTILLQLADSFSKNYKILYLASEESIEQIKIRANRLKIENSDKIFFINETDIENITASIENFNPDIVFLDSLQNCFYGEQILTNNISGLRNSAQYLINHCKNNKYTLIMTSHVTKDGNIAGPKSLEHVVDVVLYFEGDSENSFRILKSTKNRFGSTDEVGFFTMNSNGIESCKNPQKFLIEQQEPTIGSAFTWLKEGNRIFIIEIQALINESKFTNPQRIITGIEQKQLILTSAILEKYLKIPLYKYDIFCKVVGNIPLKGLYSDVSLAIALISSYLNKSLKEKIIFGGEIGLSGNIFLRENISLNNLINQFGIKKIVMPKENNSENSNFKEIKSVYELLKFFN